MPIADCRLERCRMRPLRTSAALRDSRPRAVSADRGQAVGLDQRRCGEGGKGGGEREAGGAAQHHVVDHGQRMRPFLQEADARVDHAGADEQRDAQQRGQPAHGDAGRRRRIVRAGIEREQPHEAEQAMHLARQPGGAPHRHRAPGALGVAQMEQRGDRAEPGEQQRQQRAADEEQGLRRGAEQAQPGARARPRRARETGPGRRRSAWSGR